MSGSVKKDNAKVPGNFKDRAKRKVKCWEVFQCNKKDCPAFKSRNLKCWLFAGTHCRDEIQGKFLDKMEMCLDCKVFKANKNIAAMRATLRLVNKQLKEFIKIIGDRDRQLEGMSMELAIGLSEVFEALKKISSGDPTVRIDEKSAVELISKLKHIVNLTAEEIGEIVDQSHEFAIGLAEHFDILQKVSKGDLNARVSGRSQIELLEALKKVTNKMIDSISREINDRKYAEEILQDRTHDLWERVKEINCLYSISELTEKRNVPLDYVLEETILRIPFGWRYPEITCARIILGGQEFRSKNFGETIWKHESSISVEGEKAGTVEVYYLEERPTVDEGPFIKEERDLLDAIAKHLGRFIERMKSRQALRESEEKYRTVFENTGNATIIVEEDTTISLVNTKFEVLSGYSKEEIEWKKSWIEFFDKDDSERMKEYHYIGRIDPKAAPLTYGARFIDRHGNIRNVLLSVSVIPGTKKTVESLLDITERKKLEEQMFHTEKLASIGTLAAGVAHEINNPLAIILGFTDLLLEKIPEDHEYHDLLLTIQKHGTNAKRIVENLLSFVRYKEQREEEELDVNRSIEESLAVKGKTISLNNITVIREMAESLPMMRGNPGELQQVFFNIINNAVSAMKEGGNLTIQTRTEDIDGRIYIKIQISDTGTGIEPRYRSRIFDPLFTTKGVGEGTGLGLTVAYAIIKKYAGGITFETITKDEAASSGTTFTITFPAAEQDTNRIEKAQGL
jgi:PAS domain S-box-containing protein